MDRYKYRYRETKHKVLAQISQEQDECNIYAISETMCPPGCFCYNGFVATHALGRMMHVYIYKGQSFKNVKNSLTLVVKVANLKSIARRQNILHESYESFFARQLLCIHVYFDCFMKAIAWKVKAANMFAMFIILGKMQKPFFCRLQFLWENESN